MASLTTDGTAGTPTTTTTTPTKYITKPNRIKGDKKFHTLPLPRRTKGKKKSPSKDDSESVTRKESFVDMTRRKLSHGSKEQPTVQPSQRKVGIDKDMDKLQLSEKSVKVALKWFLEVIQKDTRILLSGSTTKVLQEVIELNQCLNQCFRNEESSMLMSCHNQVHQSLANLIHWADKIALQGGAAMDKEEGCEATEAVRLGIEELVCLYTEKLHDRQLKMAVNPQDQQQQHARQPSFETKEEIYERRPLSPREQEILHKNPIGQWMFPPTRHDPTCTSVETAPPKPPLPTQRILVTQDYPSSLCPPPLPPKRGNHYDHRNSLYDDDATYQHELDCSVSASATNHHSDLSNGSAGPTSRPDSVISSQFSSPSIHSHPWEFVEAVPSSEVSRLSIQSQSSSESSGLVSNSGSDGPPPSLPVKHFQRQPSVYDNVTPEEAVELTAMCESLKEAPFFRGLPNEEGMCYPDCYEAAGDPMRQYGRDQPPPLPPKIRHINTYLDLLGGYSEDQFQMTYYEHPNQQDNNQLLQVEPHQQTYIQGREQFFYDTYYNGNAAVDGQRPLSGASYAEIDDRSVSSHDKSLDMEPPPALPIKRRGSASTSPPPRTRHNTNPERLLMPLYRLKKKSESMIESGHQANDMPDYQLINAGSQTSDNAKEDQLDDIGTLACLNVSQQLTYSTVDGKDQIRGGPIDALIVHAADADRKDLVYYEAFLTSYRMFISSNVLLDKLLNRYKRFRHKTGIDSKRANRNAFFLLLRVAGDLLGQVEDDILKMLMDLVFQLLCDGELMLAKILRDKVLTKIENNKLAMQLSNRLPLSGLGVSVMKVTLMDFSSQELAEQMTILDSGLFQKIEIPEVLLWAKEQSEELSPNLTIFTEHFNKMSFWARSLILQESRPQDREKLVVKFIKVMKHLRRLNNFNSYLAILSALDSAPVRRLEWQRQTVEGLKEYCQLIDSSSSFRTYRAALAEAEPPCIPYLGLILQDITFVHIGNPHLLPETDNINFTKCWQFFNILDSMRRFKQHHYDNLKTSNKALAFFNDFIDFLDEESMWQLSKTIKPQSTGGRPKIST